MQLHFPSECSFSNHFVLIVLVHLYDYVLVTRDGFSNHFVLIVLVLKITIERKKKTVSVIILF